MEFSVGFISFTEFWDIIVYARTAQMAVKMIMAVIKVGLFMLLFIFDIWDDSAKLR